jgi:hypothetical protein
MNGKALMDCIQKGGFANAKPMLVAWLKEEFRFSVAKGATHEIPRR